MNLVKTQINHKNTETIHHTKPPEPGYDWKCEDYSVSTLQIFALLTDNKTYSITKNFKVDLKTTYKKIAKILELSTAPERMQLIWSREISILVFVPLCDKLNNQWHFLNILKSELLSWGQTNTSCVFSYFTLTLLHILSWFQPKVDSGILCVPI